MELPIPESPYEKKDDEIAATTDGHVSDDEILINLIRKKARTTPQKPNTPGKKKTPIKRATTQEKAKNKTPVKKVASQEKVKKKTPVTKRTVQEKAKKKTPVKKSKKNVPFAPVLPPPPPPPPTVQPTVGAKRSLLYWLGG